MVVPIPAMLLDVFFVLNIALSVSVLMAAMNAQKPLDFSSFPSVLLFATLLRLALNVASTRIVLLNGHEGGAAAGKVIEAFGAFLIGGNFAVGIFVFLILMIINLMVVTKGAGRVSEVSARFTLDALPGKQMAIDADLAAGLLTADEAKARRREIATEADFYGSMDGASKFVKGDAVAALLILLINVIAGLVLGMSTHDLSAGDAASFYITLAVGDALVASVPALLLSIAAAVIVTRVSDARNLTDQISGQLSDPKIWLPVACILFIIGCIPAMPQSIILPLAAGAFWLWHSLRKREEAEFNVPEAVVIPDPAHIAIDEVTDQTLVTIQLGEATIDPSFGCPALWIDAGSRDLAVAEGYLAVDPESVIATQIHQLLAVRAQDLLGPDQVRDLIDHLRGRHGQLIETITPQPLSLAAVTRLLKALLADGISLRHSLRVFSSLSLAAQQTTEHDRLIDIVRADLGAMIVAEACPPDAKLPVITLAAQLEDMVVGGLQDPASGEIVIEPDLARSIGERIATIVAQRDPAATRPALIVQPRARRALTALLRLRAPHCLVLSINELPAAQPIEVIAVVGDEAPAQPAQLGHETEALAA
ncbi:MAG: flagellar biosynthesis protein FlhA [Sphingomonadales bacterium]